jgi:hypothetical protein
MCHNHVQKVCVWDGTGLRPACDKGISERDMWIHRSVTPNRPVSESTRLCSVCNARGSFIHDTLHAYSVTQCKYKVRWPFGVLSLHTSPSLWRNSRHTSRPMSSSSIVTHSTTLYQMLQIRSEAVGTIHCDTCNKDRPVKWSEFESCWGAIFSTLRLSGRFWRPTQLLIQWVLRVKRQEREADHSPIGTLGQCVI